MLHEEPMHFGYNVKAIVYNSSRGTRDLEVLKSETWLLLEPVTLLSISRLHRYFHWDGSSTIWEEFFAGVVLDVLRIIGF